MFHPYRARDEVRNCSWHNIEMLRGTVGPPDMALYRGGCKMRFSRCRVQPASCFLRLENGWINETNVEDWTAYKNVDLGLDAVPGISPSPLLHGF